MRLPGQADNTANLALGYSSKKLTIQGSSNYNGKFIYALGSNKEEDLWVDARWQLDVNASYKITDKFMVYVEGVNMLNSPAYTYMGNSTRVYEIQYTGAFTRIGANIRF
ncbi:TonB-dependent receptor [Flavisolibacter tropicus]|uniref:TonB-dependent receptor n=1 Tax=Flavisolibacter tropicus TaxID=1492898 RepID=UPI00082B7041|nr:TonB-dependent receptor [Flavisolibacter tropicus]